MNTGFLGPAVATVLTVYGIETTNFSSFPFGRRSSVATVLTVYGIETFLIVILSNELLLGCNSTYRLRY